MYSSSDFRSKYNKVLFKINVSADNKGKQRVVQKQKSSLSNLSVGGDGGGYFFSGNDMNLRGQFNNGCNNLGPSD
ncbi:MAG: hypothetical protein L0H53_02550 [Candidatus Nitrosocosmicus sp.]|nr:hypothetical protein [Candidatus Nitrosocosmicus sp.]